MKRLNKLYLFGYAFIVNIICTSVVFSAEYKAELTWPQIHHVSFPVDGGVVAVHVRAGESVNKGDKLIELNREPNELRVKYMKAILESKKPALVNAKREYEHTQSLYEQTVISDVELQKAELEYHRTRAEVDAATANLELARWKLNKKIARAPWNARVIKSDIEVGTMLVEEQRTKVWMTLAKLDVMGAQTNVSALTASQLDIGQRASVKVDNETYNATIKEIEQVPNAVPAAFRVMVEFPVDANNRYVAGMEATVSID